MIGGCLISATYPFLADVYTQERIKSASGQITRKWTVLKTVECVVTAFSSTSFKTQATSEKFGALYTEQGYLKMLTPTNIGRSVQVTNIRQKSNGEVVYKEIELKDTPPTWYNCNGSSPVLDPFGRIIQFDSLILRAETQGGL